MSDDYVAEPPLKSVSGVRGDAAEALRQGRWRGWYAEIADYRLAHPGCQTKDIAAYLNKGETTISTIINSDIYLQYEAQRRRVFRMKAEEQLRNRLLGVTNKAMDSLEAALDKKKDQVPLQLATDIVTMGLDRLGFAPASMPSVVVNNQIANVPPMAVSPTVLQEARMALRAVEATRIASSIAPPVDPLLFEPQKEPEPAPKPEPQEGLVDGPDPAGS